MPSATFTRVLQVLTDTDASDTNLAALELHASLTAAGIEMRTLALGPGGSGQLASVVPVIAPSRRSIAAHTQLREEQRWAQVMVLRGSQVASVAALVRGPAVPVLVLGEEPQMWSEGCRVGMRLRRLASRAAAVVVSWPEAADTVRSVLGTDPDRLRVIPTAVPVPVHSTTPAARAAARAMAGVSDERPTVRLLWDSAATMRSGAVGHADLDIDGFRDSIGAAAVVLSSALEPELARAATDIVVELDGRAGPPPELLRSMLAGAVAVTPPWPALSGLVIDGVTGRTVDAASTTDGFARTVLSLAEHTSQRAQLAAAGTARVAQDRAATELVPRWLDLLSSALASRP